MTRTGYGLIVVLLVALPFSVAVGAGVGVLAAVGGLVLTAGYLLPWLRILGAGVALASVAVAAGHGHGLGVLVAGGLGGVLVLLLLSLPEDREVDAWVLRALAIELPLAGVAAVLTGLPIGRLPLVLGAVGAAGLVAGAIPADAAVRRRRAAGTTGGGDGR